jgi:hypothetical protein
VQRHLVNKSCHDDCSFRAQESLVKEQKRAEARPCRKAVTAFR